MSVNSTHIICPVCGELDKSIDETLMRIMEASE